jgi:hypothetical protein
MGEKKNVYRVLVGKSEEKKPLGMCRYKVEHNSKTDLKEIVCRSQWPSG